MPKPRPTFAALTLITALVGSAFSAAPFEGYWKGSEEVDPIYRSYLKIEADSGYKCVLDGKSSFRFKVLGAFITTPMNGLNAIALTTPSTLRISGEEKGTPYYSDFEKMVAASYPKFCVDEEAEWYGPTALTRDAGSGQVAVPTNRLKSISDGIAYRGRFLDFLGRSLQIR